jgi:protein involved in polysaccharide export with SLBB domain
MFKLPPGPVQLLRSCSTPLWAAAGLLCAALSGCAALTNPVGDGVPVRHLDPDLLGKPKDITRTIPLSLLGQPAPDVYRLAPGDVLGVWVEGVLGDKGVVLPVYAAPQIQIRDQRRLPPAAGYPVAVREDGTVVVPLVDPVPVRGMSLAEAEDAIRAAYRKKGILPPGRERVLVTLLQPRTYHVVVVRQEMTAPVPAGEVFQPGGKRGSGQPVDLPAYENDVLHALTQTGGLPGLDAYNGVIIYRAASAGPPPARPGLGAPVETLPPPSVVGPPPCPTPAVIHIPLRLPPDTPPPFGPQDVILQSGDVVFLEARDADVFYTGGLLPPGEFILPRDVDLDVVGAIVRVKGPLVNGAFGTNTLAGNLINPGIGNPSPSLLTVLRRTPGGGQVAIRVNLNRALRDPHENILVQPGDVLILQEQPSEALARYFTQVLFNFTATWQAIQSRFFTGVTDVNTIQNVPARIGVVNNNNIVSP